MFSYYSEISMFAARASLLGLIFAIVALSYLIGISIFSLSFKKHKENILHFSVAIFIGAPIGYALYFISWVMLGGYKGTDLAGAFPAFMSELLFFI